ncbi:hypothetical protein FRACA_3290004 [Frankia canadensis]|uniref:Uncharacterized protein n=1 Tax=Frankia canadensis TaxID=1836972 RepID=A0A2I2KUQ3_9ACTN|nr:hypothetical protein FRACA_3290004 [Frankia canadensis]SOU56685.1 hypothetical protein FRACA_3290004 [Frankia canadensis]
MRRVCEAAARIHTTERAPTAAAGPKAGVRGSDYSDLRRRVTGAELMKRRRIWYYARWR